MKKKIEEKIAELKRTRDEFAQRAKEEIIAYNSAIAVLEELLSEAKNPAGTSARDPVGAQTNASNAADI